jgi:pilus assembly protein CpaF
MSTPDDQIPAHLLRAIEAARGGEGRYDGSLTPEKSPNFLYETLAPSWAASNQLASIDFDTASELSARIMDSPLADRRELEELADRTKWTPERKRRLKRIIADAINGDPARSRGVTAIEEVLSRRAGDELHIRPTDELVEEIYRLAYGWGPLEPFMEDGAVTEIMANRYDSIFIERTEGKAGARRHPAPTHFESPAVFEKFILRLVQDAQKDIDELRSPTVDFTLPDGSRVNATIPPASVTPSLTIRRKRDTAYRVSELVGFGSLNTEMAAFLSDANTASANIITYGRTGSGKTTLLTALLDEKSPERRLVIIEDTPEINLDTVTRHPNSVFMKTTPHRTLRDLVKNALRQRPDHLIVGETRDETAYDLIQAFQSGQTGSMSTIHANDPESALVRLTNLVRQAEAAPTEEPARRMVSEAIHLLVHADAFPDGRRRIVGIDEVVGLDMQFNFVVRNVFRYESEIRDGALISEAFVHNPDYVMGPELTGLFRSAGLDPDRWSGEAAKARGTRAGSEETRA